MNAKKGRKAKAGKKKAGSTTVIVENKQSRPREARNRGLRWSDTIYNPTLGQCKIPDMTSLPSGTAQSWWQQSSSVFASTNYGNVGAYQLAPMLGSAGCVRSVASVAVDTITWTAWQAVNNSTALAASGSNFRVSAAMLLGAQTSVSLTSATGLLYAVVGSYTALGGSTTGVGNILSQARSCSTGNVLSQVAKSVKGFNCSTDFDYWASGTTDGDQDILTVLTTGAATGTKLQSYGCVNWEVNVTDRQSTILPISPAVIDYEDLQRGLRKIAKYGQVMIVDSFGLGAGVANGSTAANALTGTPTQTTSTSGGPQGSSLTSGSETVSYLEQAADASGHLRVIAGNAATAASYLIGAMAVDRGRRALMHA